MLEAATRVVVLEAAARLVVLEVGSLVKNKQLRFGLPGHSLTVPSRHGIVCRIRCEVLKVTH